MGKSGPAETVSQPKALMPFLLHDQWVLGDPAYRPEHHHGGRRKWREQGQLSQTCHTELLLRCAGPRDDQTWGLTWQSKTAHLLRNLTVIGSRHIQSERCAWSRSS